MVQITVRERMRHTGSGTSTAVPTKLKAENAGETGQHMGSQPNYLHTTGNPGFHTCSGYQGSPTMGRLDGVLSS